MTLVLIIFETLCIKYLQTPYVCYVEYVQIKNHVKAPGIERFQQINALLEQIISCGSWWVKHMSNIVV